MACRICRLCQEARISLPDPAVCNTEGRREEEDKGDMAWPVSYCPPDHKLNCPDWLQFAVASRVWQTDSGSQQTQNTVVFMSGRHRRRWANIKNNIGSVFCVCWDGEEEDKGDMETTMSYLAVTALLPTI